MQKKWMNGQKAFVLRLRSVFSSMPSAIEGFWNKNFGRQSWSYFEILKMEIDSLAAMEEKIAVKAAYAELAEIIRDSDPIGHKKLIQLEEEILEEVSELVCRAEQLSEEEKIYRIRLLQGKVVVRNGRLRPRIPVG